MSDAADRPKSEAYRVLARKYRPTTFDDLIGQEALVRTLSNAIGSGRVAHAFVLTGVRGVGKTTTARLIARALNCVGPDGQGGPTITPCGVCESCRAIAEDRHVDVIEMDAASRTGIDDVRELIEGVRYRPVSARNKIYIIDEVHMLSKQAFNGLLKTLEEPPDNVVFVFATTEIRKVPVTVLSRCQRFDLKRVPEAVLTSHFAAIAEKEGIEAGEAAVAMIARAADGSVRDGLSLLDQAIALSSSAGGGPVRLDEEEVKQMLGLADRTRIFDLFEAVMAGKAPEALALLAELHGGGVAPAVVIEDLLELTHFLTRAKLVPDTLSAPALPEAERERGRHLAGELGLPALARAWQMLLKGLGETQSAPDPLQAAEMALIRLIYASDLPTPGELVKRLSEGAESAAPAPPAARGGPSGPRAQRAPRGETIAAAAQSEPLPETLAEPLAESRREPQAEPSAAAPPQPTSFAEVVELARVNRERLFASQLAAQVHPVKFEPGRIELRLVEEAPRDLAGRLGRLLETWTGRRWMVSISDQEGAPTLQDQEKADEERLRREVMAQPLVKAAMDTFPGSRLVVRREAGRPEPETDDQGDEAP